MRALKANHCYARLLPWHGVRITAPCHRLAPHVAVHAEHTPTPGLTAQVEAELAGAGLLGPGARPLEFTDLSLPFLGAVVKEAMRLHPVASLGTIRCAAARRGACKAGLAGLGSRMGRHAGVGFGGTNTSAVTWPDNSFTADLLSVCRLLPLSRQADRWVELCGYRLAPGTILWAPLISLSVWGMQAMVRHAGAWLLLA